MLIALGANLPGPLGRPADGLRAMRAILPRAGIRVLNASPLYRTRAEGDGYEGVFLNGMLACFAPCSPERLLIRLHCIEARYGRIRGTGAAPRPIDLDLIDYKGRVREKTAPPPRMPHPQAHARLFVLRPLQDVEPFWRHPRTGAPLARLLAGLSNAVARGDLRLTR